MSMLPLSSRRTPKTGSRGAAPHRRRFGFALLEALVAMAIASIALAALYRSVGQGSKNVGDVEARVEATLLARSVLAGATYAEDLAQSASGQSGAWHWVVRTAPEQVQITEENGRSASSPVSAARVTIEVSRASGGAPVASWTTWKPWRTAP